MPKQKRITGRSAQAVAASVEAQVRAGTLAAGERLPSVRVLAARLDVSPSTVAAAFAELRRRGVVVSRPRSGTRVAERPTAAATVPRVVPAGVRDLSSGNPDPALLPDVLAAFRALGGAPRLYGEAAVDAGLEAVAAAALDGDGVDPSHLCVVNGALDGIERALAASLHSGDAVAVEDPGFPAVVDVVRALGLVPLPVAIDERGMRPQALSVALAGGARAVVVTPRGQNPTGAALDARRARELCSVLAAAHDILLVEDDHLGPVAGVPAHTLAAGRERWIAVRSTSKWLGPDLRLAVLAGDAATVGRVAGRQGVGPGWVSTLTQRAVSALWADEETAALADQAATVYEGRRRALLAALAGHGLAGRGESGLNVWLPIADEEAAVAGLLAAGWAVASGARYRLRSEPAIRITAATLRPGEAARLAADLAAVLRPSRTTRAA